MRQYYEPGTEVWANWAQNQLARLTWARRRADLAVLTRVMSPAPDVIVWLKSTDRGDWIRVFGGARLVVLYTIDTGCSCSGIMQNGVQCVIQEKGVMRTRPVQRYNNVVVWSGSWLDGTYSKVVEQVGPDTVVTEEFLNWYMAGGVLRTGTRVTGGAGPFDATTTQTPEEAFGAYPPDQASTCPGDLIPPDQTVRERSITSINLASPAGPGPNPTVDRITTAARYTGVTYSPVTGYVFVDGGPQTPTHDVIPSFPPFDFDPWLQSAENTYVWGLGALSVDLTASFTDPASPGTAALAADQAAYDTAYNTRVDALEAMEADCRAAVLPSIEAALSTEEGAYQVQNALRFSTSGDPFDTILPSEVSVDVYPIEYDYDLSGTPGTGVIVPAGATISKARVRAGRRSKLFYGITPRSAEPISGDLREGREVAVASFVGNAVAVLPCTLGDAERTDFLARLALVDNDVSQLSDADKVLSMFFDNLPPMV